MQYGLLGKSLKHSFSKDFFTKKFKQEKLIDHSYSNFELAQIEELTELIEANPKLAGLNVTIPYKKEVIPFLSELSPAAKAIGAVNVIQFKNGKLIGHNSDWIGFGDSLKPLINDSHKRALILGTGGASKAVAYALQQLDIDYRYVSRKKSDDCLTYSEASSTLDEFQIIINTTPLGTFPNTNEIPPLSLEKASDSQLYFDLIYNPEKTRFLNTAQQAGAQIKNGLEMLILQANKSWEIWNEF